MEERNALVWVAKLEWDVVGERSEVSLSTALNPNFEVREAFSTLTVERKVR